MTKTLVNASTNLFRLKADEGMLLCNYNEYKEEVNTYSPDVWFEVLKDVAAMPYDEAVDAEIRKRYTVSQEFAILRQRDEKPKEYAEYYAYCEECKALVKALFDRCGVEYSE